MKHSRIGVGGRGTGWALASALLLGCGADPGTNGPEAGPEEVGLAQAELTTVPTGVTCVRITVGSTNKNFTVTAGAPSSKLDLGQLPVGWLTASGAAYNVACPGGGSAPTASPTWMSDPTTVQISAGVVATISIALRPAQAAVGAVDFRVSPSSIAIGYIASYAITPDGSAWMWGYDQAGTLGSAGSRIRTATKISSLSGVVQIAGGSGNACALLNDTSVRCWGANWAGQLGDGTTTDRASPVLVSGLLGVASIASGYHHVCATLLDGSVVCWGRNDYGQLGNGTTTNALTPVRTSYGTNRVLSVSAGPYHTCMLTSARNVICSGDNIMGELGNGTTTPNPSHTFQTALNSLGTSTLVVGGVSTFVIRGDGSVYAWGGNAFGQLGDGTTTNRPSPVQILGLTGATQIGVGEYHGCALMQFGTVTCFGTNYSGRLGTGNPTNYYTPTTVVNLTNAVQIVAHYSHSCARTQDDNVYCWGEGYYGQLGDNLLADSYVPTRTVF